MTTEFLFFLIGKSSVGSSSHSQICRFVFMNTPSHMNFIIENPVVVEKKQDVPQMYENGLIHVCTSNANGERSLTFNGMYENRIASFRTIVNRIYNNIIFRSKNRICKNSTIYTKTSIVRCVKPYMKKYSWEFLRKIRHNLYGVVRSFGNYRLKNTRNIRYGVFMPIHKHIELYLNMSLSKAILRENNKNILASSYMI